MVNVNETHILIIAGAMTIGSRNVTALQFHNTWYFNHVTQEFIDGPNLRISRAGTNIFVPGYFGIMVTRQQQFCCIFATTKDKFDYFLNKLFHSSTLHTYHQNSNFFLYRHVFIMSIIYLTSVCLRLPSA